MTAAQADAMLTGILNQIAEEARKYPTRIVFEQYRPGPLRMQGVGRAVRLMTVGDREVFAGWLEDEDGNPVVGT